ncbi:MAG: hypothetical protein KGL94_10560, partial [Acidobacteriota bacterium]|nr:hypothetical protein [Acidobacteriota bacterium]
FWRRQDDLERELRAHRPEPRRELVDEIARMVAGERRRAGGRAARLGVAAALTAGMLGVLGAFGGLSYAANGVTNAVTAAVHLVAPAKPVKLIPAGSQSSAMAQYKVTLCFHGHTIDVDSHAVDALVSAGATQGACHGVPPKPDQKLIRACFHGQNVSLSDPSLLALQNRLLDLRRALAAAARAHDRTKELALLADIRRTDQQYLAQLQKLHAVDFRLGFCKG